MGQCAHLRNYATLPDCQVVALAEPRPETRRRVAARYAIPATYSDVFAMLAAEELDGIVASQPFDRHGELLPRLIPYGIPVFIEKPLGSTLAAGQAVLAALAAQPAAARAFVMVGYHKRCDPATRYAVEQIRALQASGELGPLTYLRITMPAGDWIANGFDGRIAPADDLPDAEMLPPSPPAADMDAATFGHYTAFVNYYIHQVNLMRHLLGESWQVTYANPGGVLLAGNAASGVPVAIEMTPYRTTVDWQESALVAFARGYVKLELPAPLAHNRPGRVEILRDPGGVTPTVTSPQLPWDHAMRLQARAFCAAIRGEAPPPCDAATAQLDLLVARDYIRLRHGV